jgi:hypothetical protein
MPEKKKTTFVWFDIGYTLLYNMREPTYQQVLREYGAEVSEHDLVHAFHRVDKIFMREYPGVLGKDPRTYSPARAWRIISNTSSYPPRWALKNPTRESSVWR